MNKGKRQTIITILFIILFIQIFGVIIPRIIIKDSSNKASTQIAKFETKISYLDKPIPRLLTIDMQAYKENEIIYVNVYTYFGLKLARVEFKSDGGSRADWSFF